MSHTPAARAWRGLFVAVDGLVVVVVAALVADAAGGGTTAATGAWSPAAVPATLSGWWATPGVVPLELVADAGVLAAVAGPLWYWVIGPLRRTDADDVDDDPEVFEYDDEPGDPPARSARDTSTDGGRNQTAEEPETDWGALLDAEGDVTETDSSSTDTDGEFLRGGSTAAEENDPSAPTTATGRPDGPLSIEQIRALSSTSGPHWARPASGSDGEAHEVVDAPASEPLDPDAVPEPVSARGEATEEASGVEDGPGDSTSPAEPTPADMGTGVAEPASGEEELTAEEVADVFFGGDPGDGTEEDGTSATTVENPDDGASLAVRLDAVVDQLHAEEVGAEDEADSPEETVDEDASDHDVDAADATPATGEKAGSVDDAASTPQPEEAPEPEGDPDDDPDRPRDPLERLATEVAVSRERVDAVADRVTAATRGTEVRRARRAVLAVAENTEATLGPLDGLGNRSIVDPAGAVDELSSQQDRLDRAFADVREALAG